MASEAKQNPWSTFVWGVSILAAGVVFWLDNLGHLDARDWLEWWPVVLIAVGLAQLPNRQWIGAAIWFAIGSYFLLAQQGYDVPAFWEVVSLWPLLISAAGITLIVQTLRSGRSMRRFRAFAVMAGNHVTMGSREFEGGQAVAVMGGCEIDLRDAKSPAPEATIDVLAFWGGIDIRVPRGWTVVNRVAPILGGFEDKTEAGSGPRLIVRGAAIMGGVEVKSSRETPESGS
jgi:hypothetical protein